MPVATADLSEPACGARSSTGSMVGILYIFGGVGFLIVLKKGSLFHPGVMSAKSSAWGSVSRVEGPGVKGLGLKVKG